MNASGQLRSGPSDVLPDERFVIGERTPSGLLERLRLQVVARERGLRSRTGQPATTPSGRLLHAVGWSVAGEHEVVLALARSAPVTYVLSSVSADVGALHAGTMSDATGRHRRRLREHLERFTPDLVGVVDAEAEALLASWGLRGTVVVLSGDDAAPAHVPHDAVPVHALQVEAVEMESDGRRSTSVVPDSQRRNAQALLDRLLGHADVVLGEPRSRIARVDHVACADVLARAGHRAVVTGTSVARDVSASGSLFAVERVGAWHPLIGERRTGWADALHSIEQCGTVTATSSLRHTEAITALGELAAHEEPDESAATP